MNRTDRDFRGAAPARMAQSRQDPSIRYDGFDPEMEHVGEVAGIHVLRPAVGREPVRIHGPEIRVDLGDEEARALGELLVRATLQGWRRRP